MTKTKFAYSRVEVNRQTNTAITDIGEHLRDGSFTLINYLRIQWTNDFGN